MDTTTNTTGEEQTGKRQKIVFIILFILAGGIGIYYFLMRNRTDLDKQMERVRQAKADKKILSNVQNDN
jgi:hypothetical protein